MRPRLHSQGTSKQPRDTKTRPHVSDYTVALVYQLMAYETRKTSDLQEPISTVEEVGGISYMPVA